jgi:hypothetical protein
MMEAKLMVRNDVMDDSRGRGMMMMMEPKWW